MDQLADLQVIDLTNLLEYTSMVRQGWSLNININHFQRKIETAKQRRDENRGEMTRLLQEKREKLEELRHLELRVELQDYLQRTQ